MHNDLFVPAQGIYLLNHSVGRMPASARDYVEQHYFSVWQTGSPDPWSLWLAALEQFNSALANLFNSEQNYFCPQPNISSAVGKTLAALPAKKDRNVILMSENDFPSVGFSIQQAERMGFQIRFIPDAFDLQQVQTWDDALTSDIHTVLITHVHYNTNRLIPVDQVTALTRARGITSIVDIAQSSGVVPIDLQQWQADIVVGSCVKWLCGGPGAGFIWVDPQVIGELKPIDVGWFSHQNPFEFDIHNFEYAEHSARFWGGTPSVLPYVVATNSINLLDSIGISTVREQNQRFTESIINSINPDHVVTPLAPDKRGGTLVIKMPRQEQVIDALNDAGVLFDLRALGMRLSPHIYNTQDEIDCVIDCLKAGNLS